MVRHERRGRPPGSENFFADLLKAAAAHPLRSIAALACAEFAQQRRQGFVGKATRIWDGDTIGVEQRGVERCIRLYGVDAPEGGQPFGACSTSFAEHHAGGRIVTVTPVGTDIHDRLVGVVSFRDGRVLNHEMVLSGCVWWFEHFAPDDGVLATLEAAAKASGRALWADPAAVAPWRWRRAHK